MSLLGHKTDLMFRRYIQKRDDRLVKTVTRLAKRPKELSGAGWIASYKESIRQLETRLQPFSAPKPL